jgi:hypothetical protein
MIVSTPKSSNDGDRSSWSAVRFILASFWKTDMIPRAFSRMSVLTSNISAVSSTTPQRT